MRLTRLYPGSLVKPAVRTILVPKPMTAHVGGRPLRDRELLQWADRVFVIGLWKARETPPGTPVERREETLVFNGLAWPHTGRLTHTVGDTVHWRVINATRRAHPMHLHGFYYRVDARGSPVRDTTYRDTTAKPNVRYVYAIVAVDKATPRNTSPESNRVEESAR